MPKPDIHLYTAATLNGWKPLIFLTEADIDYQLTPIDLTRREQKADWYLALNPNGRIPTLVDRGNGGFRVIESGAILWYLAEKYRRFLSDDPNIRSETLQWLMFQVSGIGPIMGQAEHYRRIAPREGENNPAALTRFVDESRRLLEVLNTRLAARDWLAGDAYSIADMATYPWVRSTPWAGVSIDDLEHLQGWLARIGDRPKTRAALQLPAPRPSLLCNGDIGGVAPE